MPGGINNGGPTSHAAQFTLLIRNRIHECAPDHSVETISVGELRKAADTIEELYEALRTCVRLCDKALGKPINLKGESPLDIANAALAKARGDQ